jgi:class 3 adenylate cyclase
VASRGPKGREAQPKKRPALATGSGQGKTSAETSAEVANVPTLRQALADALDREAATREILGVISRSSSELQPVFDTIVATAARLCQAEYALIFKFENGKFSLVAANSTDADYVKFIAQYPPWLGRETVTGRTVLERAVVHVPDVLKDPEHGRKDAQQIGKYRALLGVPLMHEGEPIGVIFLVRTEARPFEQTQIELVTSFADQATIAIETVRMFNEIQDQARQIEEQAAQLVDWNRTLESRVDEQVSQLTRLNRLTRFHSPKIVDLIMSGEADDPLQTRRSEVTVVYADLRGFTGFTETADPEEVIGVLREYHAELGRAIVAYEGTIEHFAGDGAMVLFNAPMPVAEHELQAIRMTIEIRKALTTLSSVWRKRGYELGFGAGIASGYATLGTVGFEERLDYGAIGTVCNLAARLCGEAEDGQILISPRVFAKLEAQIDAMPVGALTLKGFHRPVKAYDIRGISQSPGFQNEAQKDN